MKRNTKKLAFIGLFIGCLTIGSVSIFALANGNPYQDLKNAILLTVQKKNMTITADVSIRQDGEAFLSGDTVVQLNEHDKYTKSQVQFGGETVVMESSQMGETEIFRIGDDYTKTTGRENEEDERFDASPNTLKLAEIVADLLVGDLNTHFFTSGGTITVNLEGAQIPELLNIAVSAGLEKTAGKHNKTSPEKELLGNVLENLSITQDVQVKSAGMEAQLEDGYISKVVVTLILTGKDSNGTLHKIEILCNAAISNIGSTTPDTVNIDGKTVTEAVNRHR